MDLDLRVGAALTRTQTMGLQNRFADLADKLISYGALSPLYPSSSPDTDATRRSLPVPNPRLRRRAVRESPGVHPRGLLVHPRYGRARGLLGPLHVEAGKAIRLAGRRDVVQHVRGRAGGGGGGSGDEADAEVVSSAFGEGVRSS